MRKLHVLIVILLAAGVAHAKTKKKAADPPAPAAVDPADLYDVSAFKAKLLVTTDGKSHFLASAPDLSDDATKGLLFYSDDGKTFYQQRVYSYGGEGKIAFDLTFWEPRVVSGWQKSYGFRDGKYTIQCDERKTEFKPLPASEAKAMLDAAVFRKPRWKHRAYALARDDSGRYFYVDVAREPENSKAFRLYMGKKNELKPLKMTNVVSDSEGDIFATKSGELRLIIPKEGPGSADAMGSGPNKREPIWIKGKKKTPLTWVPVEDNGNLIYTELGVYVGQPLGTPCDDL